MMKDQEMVSTIGLVDTKEASAKRRIWPEAFKRQRPSPKKAAITRSRHFMPLYGISIYAPAGGATGPRIAFDPLQVEFRSTLPHGERR